MTNLTARIKRLAEFDKKAFKNYIWSKITCQPGEAARWENARLLPLINALAECAEALDENDKIQQQEFHRDVCEQTRGCHCKESWRAKELKELTRLVVQMEKERGE